MREFEHIATGRKDSCFTGDLDAHSGELREKLDGTRVLIIGAAGSIGASVVLSLIPYGCKNITLVDLSENNLVELIRNLRSQNEYELPSEVNIVPLDYGSREFSRYLDDQDPFDYIFNLSAMKHVRSEQDVYSIYRMFKTNVVYLHELLSNLKYTPKKVFSVSSDKAANPANLMGASKKAMELVLEHFSDKFPVSSARFANVAFSDGSLPYGFIERINKKQCISSPNDIRRFFISHKEAGELCVLSAVLGENNEIFYPKVSAQVYEKYFHDIAKELLEIKGYKVKLCANEDEARDATKAIDDTKEWPCFFSSSGTSGEKPYEEFFTDTEQLNEAKFKNVGFVTAQMSDNQKAQYNEFISFLKKFIEDSSIEKKDIVEEVAKLIPTLSHIETGTNLNNKM